MDNELSTNDVIDILTYLKDSLIKMASRDDMRYAPLFYDIESKTFAKALDIAIDTILKKRYPHLYGFEGENKI